MSSMLDTVLAVGIVVMIFVATLDRTPLMLSLLAVFICGAVARFAYARSQA